MLKVERRSPGLFFWLGRKRVSRHQANDAFERSHTDEAGDNPASVAAGE
jgi:hypothetical protein